MNGANLTGADLRGANLTRADLRGANLIGYYDTGTDLKGVDLTGADLNAVNWSGAKLSDAERDKAGLSEIDLMAPDLSRISEEVTQRGVDLRGSDLTNAILTRFKLNLACLSGVKLSKADLKWADLTEADLRGADLSGADLRCANMSKVDLTGANLTGAYLSIGNRIEFENITEVASSILTEAKLNGAKTGKYDLVWDEINSQLDSLGLVINNGVVQDATFITSDPGHAKADKPRGNEAKKRRSKDGTWAKKSSKSSFGYKLHSKVDIEFGLMRDLETTTASLHYSQVDLSNEGEVVYRDKGYFGVEAKGYSATMNRATRGHPLSIQDEMRNKRISKKRAPVERHYAVIKRVFGAAHVTVTTIARVHVKMVLTAIAFNLFQLRTLKKQNVI